MTQCVHLMSGIKGNQSFRRLVTATTCHGNFTGLHFPGVSVSISVKLDIIMIDNENGCGI